MFVFNDAMTCPAAPGVQPRMLGEGVVNQRM